MESKVVALIPAYNESKNLSSLIPAVQKWIRDVVVIDDGSTDPTAEVARSAGASVLHHPENRGKGAALQTGFRYLSDKGYEGCLILDGDGQHSPEDIPVFLESRADPRIGVVIGNRMQETSTMPRLRRWTNAFMSFVLSRFLREEIPDTQCGFRYIRAELLRLSDLNASRYAIDSEILIEAKRHGFRIKSVPVRTIYRDQKSGIRPLRDTYFFLKLLLEKRKSFRSPP